MSETKHTPGPWDFVEKGRGRKFTLKRTYWEIGDIATQAGIALAFGSTEVDARLIAAAPDLLAALERLADSADVIEQPTKADVRERAAALKQAQEAIGKAVGA